MSIVTFSVRAGEPGFRRNQLIVPRHGVVRADVEDDFHHFWIELVHDGQLVTDLRTGAIRVPWSTCTEAGDFLRARMRGQRLDALAEADSALLHCTHLHDLAFLAAAHALDTEPTLYSCFASEEGDPFRTVELYRNGKEMLRWELSGSDIVSPGPGHGETLRKLKSWEGGLTPELREAARILRRAAFLSSGRTFRFQAVATADQIPKFAGACYSFQPERSPKAMATMDQREFGYSEIPLQPRIEQAFAESGERGDG